MSIRSAIAVTLGCAVVCAQAAAQQTVVMPPRLEPLLSARNESQLGLLTIQRIPAHASIGRVARTRSVTL